MKNKRFMVIIFILLFSLHLTGCKNQSAQISESYIEDFTQVKVDELMKYKDSYIGDNSAVINIVSALPGNRYDPSFSLKTKEKPYGLAISYKVNEKVEDEGYLNFWKDINSEKLLENNAMILFSLIPNVESIKFEIEGIDNVTEYSYEYSRKELESKYNLNLVDLSVNKESFGDYLKAE